MSQPEKPSAPQPLVEGIDYYIEAGRWVFTEAYLLRRGECCGSECRHCPYKDGKFSPGGKQQSNLS